MEAWRACSHQSRLYSDYSHLYERIFTRVCRPHIHSTIESLGIERGARVLEVGVGTGLSLSAYPAHAEVTGIDIAHGMLVQAERKVNEHGWEHVRLRQMDGLHMDFPDESFDYVTAFHVLSVVRDPEGLVREMLRVSKSHGTVVIINHFRSERKWLAPFVDLFDPVTRRLGWRTTIRLSEVVDGAPLRVRRRFKTSARSLFTVVVGTKTDPINGHSVGLPNLGGNGRRRGPNGGNGKRSRGAGSAKRSC